MSDETERVLRELKPDTGGLAYLKPLTGELTGEPAGQELPGPWREDVVREALRLLRIEDHIIDDDEAYEAFLAGNFSGCTVCEAGFLLRGMLEGRALPALPLPQYAEDESDPANDPESGSTT